MYELSLRDNMAVDVSRLNWQQNIRREITAKEWIHTYIY